jgi:hypothetical protein
LRILFEPRTQASFKVDVTFAGPRKGLFLLIQRVMRELSSAQRR